MNSGYRLLYTKTYMHIHMIKEGKGRIGRGREREIGRWRDAYT